jgi:pimeloyl-ACP methyl ester carboxylesterase
LPIRTDPTLVQAADLARADMESIRGALGVPQVTVFAQSYGSHAGEVYSTQYPNRVKRLILDSSSVSARHRSSGSSVSTVDRRLSCIAVLPARLAGTRIGFAGWVNTPCFFWHADAGRPVRIDGGHLARRSTNGNPCVNTAIAAGRHAPQPQTRPPSRRELHPEPATNPITR